MAAPFTTTDEVKNVIMFYEGFSAEPYSDYSQFSIGFGSGIDLNGNPVTASTPSINKRQAETLFTDVTLPIYEAGVANVVQRNDLPVEALSALVSFAYNLGVAALGGSSLLARIEASKWNDVAYQWSRWKNVTPANAQVSLALCRRRHHEFGIFRDAVIVAGLATAESFQYTMPRNNDDTIGGIGVDRGISGTGDPYDYGSFTNFCSIVERRADASVSKDPWRQRTVRDPDTGEVIRTITGPFFPNLGSSTVNAAPDTSTEAAEQGVAVVAIGNDERRLQPPLVAGGMPVVTVVTPAGRANAPPTTPPSPAQTPPPQSMVLIGGIPVGLPSDIHPSVPSGTATKISTRPDILVAGQPMVCTLDPTSDGHIVGPGNPTVISGI